MLLLKRRGKGVAGPGPDISIPFLDEQPVLPRADERPVAEELVPVQGEQQFALQEALTHVEQGRVAALVPDDHRTRTVIALGDNALEVRIAQRVRLGLDREPLVGGVGGRALGNGPAQEDAVVLEPEVEVRPACEVVLHDEAPATYGSATHGLGRPGRVAAVPVFLEICVLPCFQVL